MQKYAVVVEPSIPCMRANQELHCHELTTCFHCGYVLKRICVQCNQSIWSDETIHSFLCTTCSTVRCVNCSEHWQECDSHLTYICPCQTETRKIQRPCAVCGKRECATHGGGNIMCRSCHQSVCVWHTCWDQRFQQCIQCVGAFTTCIECKGGMTKEDISLSHCGNPSCKHMVCRACRVHLRTLRYNVLSKGHVCWSRTELVDYCSPCYTEMHVIQECDLCQQRYCGNDTTAQFYCPRTSRVNCVLCPFQYGRKICHRIPVPKYMRLEEPAPWVCREHMQQFLTTPFVSWARQHIARNRDIYNFVRSGAQKCYMCDKWIHASGHTRDSSCITSQMCTGCWSHYENRDIPKVLMESAYVWQPVATLIESYIYGARIGNVLLL